MAFRVFTLRKNKLSLHLQKQQSNKTQLKIKATVTFVLIFLTLLVKAQDPNERGNLRHYYDQPLHFGFTLGVNKSSFMIDPAPHFERFDSLKRVEVDPKIGFNLGIIAELRLHKYLTLRFIPNLSFVERTMLYKFEGYDDIIRTKTIESTFINFPLNLKLRSKRVHNVSAYVLGGGSYTIDLASKKKIPLTSNPNLNEQIVKLNNYDIYYEAGTGIEFYLEYFKLALEAKISIGTTNVLIGENTIFSNSINRLNSKIFLFSITFEG